MLIAWVVVVLCVGRRSREKSRSLLNLNSVEARFELGSPVDMVETRRHRAPVDHLGAPTRPVRPRAADRLDGDRLQMDGFSPRGRELSRRCA